MLLVVGSIVMLTVPLLNNPIGTIGVCYETYTLGKDHKGASIIFENGEYDGFNADEQDSMLEKLGTVQLPYMFTNVMNLSRSYDQHVFDSYFEMGKIMLTKRNPQGGSQ